MEVHAHTHTPRKKWTHYFWEFLMLFLAVFCGFLAEYQLEHKIEHDREKQYIRSMVADIEENNRLINSQLSLQKVRMKRMDTLIALCNNPASIRGNEGAFYYLGRISPRLNTVRLNSRTYEQLKNSGNFRLIRDMKSSDMIIAYYEDLPLLRQLEELYQKEFDQYKILASRIFDPAVFIRMETSDGGITRTEDNPALQSYDPSVIKQFNVFAVYMNGSARGILQQSEELLTKGEALLAYLKKEYHLK
ncbi:MAG TPA: hypothetical protein VK483_02790 [Chitinophagaceae bacterium]|nr:hypothetical protein [Chitinophagaceae bacterium]